MVPTSPGTTATSPETSGLDHPVGRLAPSPSGHLHAGHARSFLLAWWSLRSRGGRVVLRIEDLDPERVKPGAVDDVLRDLEWLGLDWDAGPFFQSREPEPGLEAIDHLLSRDQAYLCACSRREVEEAAQIASAPHDDDPLPGGVQIRYPGTCRGRFTSRASAAEKTGEPLGVRFQVPPGPVQFEDVLRGPLTHDVQAQVGDFLIQRRDGVMAYQLAVVVDDARQGVTEVLRGDDLLSSTARQALLMEALGLPRPSWIHVPLVVDDEGERLAKRRGSLDLTSMRLAGASAEALIGWCARSLGLDVDGPISADEATRAYDLDRIPQGPSRFGLREAAVVMEG